MLYLQLDHQSSPLHFLRLLHFSLLEAKTIRKQTEKLLTHNDSLEGDVPYFLTESLKYFFSAPFEN